MSNQVGATNRITPPADSMSVEIRLSTMDGPSLQNRWESVIRVGGGSASGAASRPQAPVHSTLSSWMRPTSRMSFDRNASTRSSFRSSALQGSVCRRRLWRNVSMDSRAVLTAASSTRSA